MQRKEIRLILPYAIPEITDITENFYSTLYQEKNSKLSEEDNKKILIVVCEKLLYVTVEKIQLTLSQITNKRLTEDDGITSEMTKLGGTGTTNFFHILFSNCLTKIEGHSRNMAKRSAVSITEKWLTVYNTKC